jgi:hypothetical protein
VSGDEKDRVSMSFQVEVQGMIGGEGIEACLEGEGKGEDGEGKAKAKEVSSLDWIWIDR